MLERRHRIGFGCQLAEFDKVYRILTGNPLGIEGRESEERFALHVSSQPCQVLVLVCIPEEFLFLPDTVD